MNRRGFDTAPDFGTYSPRFFDSGTAALAAALAVAVRVKPCDSPEVIVPAYGCPSLVAAARFAGATPVFVDLDRARPWLNLGRLANAFSERTVAVVAVDLFGIPERLDAIKRFTRQRNILLIEDSAQYLPPGSNWKGDFVILSFGRGKPVSLLGGGAVLGSRPDLLSALPRPTFFSNGTGFPLKARMYNLLRRPCLYWLPRRMPGLQLGKTHYRPLIALGSLDRRRQKLLAANIARYRLRRGEIALLLRNALTTLPSLVDVAAATDANPRFLTRYPVLLSSRTQRDRALHRLERGGLGATAMYGRPLPDLPGIGRIRVPDLPMAHDFSERLLTLPVHELVTERHVRSMCSILGSVLGDSSESAICEGKC